MTIIKYLVWLSVLLFTSDAHSYRSCQNIFDPFYGVYRTQCKSGVDFNQFQKSAYQSQHQSQWCWAASISMVFAHAGYDVDQRRIVNEAYGGIVNLPAQGWQLAQNLNRNWLDDEGNSFRSTLSGLYDASQGVVGLADSQIIDELSKGNPLVIGTGGHAMVLTEVGYYLNAFGGFDGYAYATVFDPWPGRGARYLSGAEFTRADFGSGGTMQFLASATVRSTDERTNTFATGDSQSGSAGNASKDFEDVFGVGSFSFGVCYLLVICLAVTRNLRRKVRFFDKGMGRNIQ